MLLRESANLSLLCSNFSYFLLFIYYLFIWTPPQPVSGQKFAGLPISTMPRSFKVRYIPYPVNSCTRQFTNQGGLKNHIRTHRTPQANQDLPAHQQASPRTKDFLRVGILGHRDIEPNSKLLVGYSANSYLSWRQLRRIVCTVVAVAQKPLVSS